MVHDNSLPRSDRTDYEEDVEKFLIRWGGLTVAIHAEDGMICVRIRKGDEDFYMVITPEDVDRLCTKTPFILPEVFQELNNALVACAKKARQ